MRLWLLLFILSVKLRIDAKRNEAFKNYIGTTRLRFMIKTADGKWGRLFKEYGDGHVVMPGAERKTVLMAALLLILAGLAAYVVLSRIV
jgi:hypothetical protein